MKETLGVYMVGRKVLDMLEMSLEWEWSNAQIVHGPNYEVKELGVIRLKRLYNGGKFTKCLENDF